MIEEFQESVSSFGFDASVVKFELSEGQAVFVECFFESVYFSSELDCGLIGFGNDSHDLVELLFLILQFFELLLKLNYLLLHITQITNLSL